MSGVGNKRLDNLFGNAVCQQKAQSRLESVSDIHGNNWPDVVELNLKNGTTIALPICYNILIGV
jgi:hypothetical protein